LFLVFLSTGDGFAALGAHFGIGTQTAWRYVDDTITALAPLAPSLFEAIGTAGPRRRLLLDGTLTPTWRCNSIANQANADPLYNGKQREHGMTVKGLTDTTGEPVFLGQAHPGCTHDLAAARADGIIDAVTDAGIETLADSGYQGAGGTVRTPIKRRPRLHNSEHEKHANSEHARHRVPVELSLRAPEGLARADQGTDQPEPDQRIAISPVRRPPETIFTRTSVDEKRSLPGKAQWSTPLLGRSLQFEWGARADERGESVVFG
jgi:hypothetical protein